MNEQPLVPYYEAKKALQTLLRYLGENPDREGLVKTPDRVLKSYEEIFAGYRQDPKDVMTVFEDGACDEMVVLKGISLVSFCEHHMLPFTGVAHVAYVPNGRIIGVSKLARIVDIYARRLQVQERITTQITAALDKHLSPKGSACVIQASHSCMGCRGVSKPGAVMVTSSLTGCFRQEGTRAEFLDLIRT